MTGARFDGGGMPVEAAPELAAYRDLVISLAEELFRQRNPGRQRLPARFEDRLQLRLETVEQGSAVLVIERRGQPGTACGSALATADR
jgi:hypothetical protein